MTSLTRTGDNTNAAPHEQSRLTMDSDLSRGRNLQGQMAQAGQSGDGTYTPYTLPVLYLPPGAVTRAAWLMARQLQQALTEQTAAYWLRRAETFDAVGNERCNQIAENCRNHARLVAGEFDYPGGVSDEVWDYLTDETDALKAVAA